MRTRSQTTHGRAHARRSFAALATAIAAALVVVPSAPAIVETGTLGIANGNATTGTQTGQISNDGGFGNCTTPSTTTLFSSTGSRLYNAHTFSTGAAAACVTASLTMQCDLGIFVQFVAYLGTYDPSNPLRNYLADWGAAVTNRTISMSFTVPANSNFVIVVVENDPGIPGTCQYSLEVTGAGVSTVALPVTLRALSASRSAAGVTVRWRTASEPDLLGFHVYRGVGRKRVKLSRRLIPSNGGGVYSYVDRTANVKQSARYWLEAVHLDGSRTWYGPVFAGRGRK